MLLAYLDAGTGSLILQTVLGGAAGLAVLFKTTGRRLFKRTSAAPDGAAEQTAASAEQSSET